MTYPLTYPDAGDARFTGELLDEIGNVLVAHGYPPVDGDDTAFAGLREALRTFLYGPDIDYGDHVAWFDAGQVLSGTVEVVAKTDNGLVARILTDSRPAMRTVVPCRDLTPIPEATR